MSATRPVSIFDPLTTQEEGALKFIETTLATKNPEKMQSLIHIIKNLNHLHLYRYSQHSQHLKDFCSEHIEFHEQWIEVLKTNGYPYLSIRSTDGKTVLSPFDLLIAMTPLSVFIGMSSRDINSEKAINSACDLGLYNALVMRCKMNLKIMETPNQKQEKTDSCIKVILADCATLSNLYWGLGYIQSGCMLRDISNVFATRVSAEHDDEEFSTFYLDQAKTFAEVAVKNFLCAAYLKEHEFSNNIINSLPDALSFIAQITKKGNMEQWMQTQTMQYSEMLGETYLVIEKNAKDEIAAILAIENIDEDDINIELETESPEPAAVSSSASASSSTLFRHNKAQATPTKSEGKIILTNLPPLK